MSLYQVDLTAIGHGVRPLTHEELAAYFAEVALRHYDDALHHGTREEREKAEQEFLVADDALYSLVGPEGHEAARAFADEYFDRISPAPTQTIAERAYDHDRRVANG